MTDREEDDEEDDDDDESNGSCRQRILNTKKYLHQENISFSCAALDEDNCSSRFQRFKYV